MDQDKLFEPESGLKPHQGGDRVAPDAPDRDDPQPYPEKLYDGRPPAENVPTSRAAASSVHETSQTIRAAVYAMILASGDNGRTDDEIEERTGLRHQTASARRRELVLLGQIVDSKRTRPTRSGRQATVWVVKDVRPQ